MNSAHVTSLVSSLVTLLGGVDNITGISRCFTRLRVNVDSREAVKLAAIERLDEVSMVFIQTGEIHIVPRRDLDSLVEVLSSVVGR